MSPSMRILYFVLLGLSLFSLWSGIHELSQVPLGNIQGFVMLGTGMLIFAWVIIHPAKPLADSETDSLQRRISARFDALAQTLLAQPLIYVGMLVSGLTVALSTKQALQPLPILILWVTGMVIFLIGAATPGMRVKIYETSLQAVEWTRSARWELAAVLTLTLLAFLGRGIALGTIPHNVHGDEGEMGLLARAVLHGELRDPFTSVFLAHPSLWFFIQALALRLFGNSIVGLRMLSALLGTLTIPALYVFARPLYGRLVAILSATLLTFFHFHLHFSRIGLNNIADPLMMLLTLAAFFYGYQKRSLVGFALAGILMGLAQYFYFGTRLILVIVLVLVVFLVIKERQQWQTLAGHILLLVVGFLIAAGPLVRYYVTHPDVYYGRMLERGLFQNGAIHLPDLQANGQSLFQALLGHAYRTFGLYVSVNELGPFYDSGTPILNHGMELLFLIGVILAVLNWRKMESFVLPLWVAGTALFGGFLLSDGLQGQRYLIATPALCILMAMAIVQITALLSPIMKLSQLQQSVIITLMVAAYTAWNLYFYFGIYTPQNRYAYNPSATEIANYLRNRAGQAFAYMFTPTNLYLNYGTIKFVANDPPGMDVLTPLTSIATLPEPPSGLRPVFIFIPERLNELELVKERYPNGNLREYSRPQDPQHPYIYIYEPQ